MRSTSRVLVAFVISVVGLFFIFEAWARFAEHTTWRTDPFYDSSPNEKNFSIITSLENVSPKKTGYRIVVTGGSVAYGWGASDEAHRFPAVLERVLRSKLGRADIEVINAGVPDFTASDELILYSEKLRSLHPDLLIMFTGFNDIWDTLKYSLTANPAPRLAHTFEHRVIAPTQSFELLLTFFRSLAVRVDRPLARWSKAYEWSRDHLRHLTYKPIKNLSAFHETDACESLQGFLDAILAMGVLSKSHGCKLMVVIQPVRFLSNIPQDQFPISRYERVLQKVFQNCLSPKLKRLSVDYGVMIVDSNPVLSNALIERRAYIDFCHVNDEGNAMIGESVATQMNEKITF